METCIVIDVWEGQLEIDEAALKANDVYGIGIRLNDMAGGHHKDAGFDKQWQEASNFVRFPYFVYNPWVNGQANYDWLLANCPETKTVAIDIEVKYSAVSPAEYAGEVEKFLQLVEKKWKFIIYTAEWFLPYLSKWRQCDYWWAQYPSQQTFFSGVTTWEELRLRLENPTLQFPFNKAKIPGTLKLWQFTGDYLILPGSNQNMDVNLFYGTKEELEAYFGGTVTDPVPPVPVTTEPSLLPIFTGKVTIPALNVRITPGSTATKLGTLYWNNTIDVYEIRNVGNNVWGRIASGWVALMYAGFYYTTWRKPPEITSKIAYVLPRILGYDGPAIIAGSDAPKQNHPTIALDTNWQTFIRRLSDDRQDVWDLFKDQWVGPSKGINSNGKLVYIPATWSFNVVRLTGKRENGWVEIECINCTKAIPNISLVNHYVTPTLVSRMTTTNKDGGWLDYPLKDGVTNPWISLNDPILSLTGFLWIPEMFVTTNCTLATTLNIRAEPTTTSAKVGLYGFSTTVQILDVVNEGQNAWGKTDKGWICLKYGNTYFTDWKVR